MAEVFEEIAPDELEIPFDFIRDHPNLDFNVAVRIAGEICREFSHLKYDAKAKKVVYLSGDEAMGAYLDEQMQNAGLTGGMNDEAIFKRLGDNVEEFSKDWKETHAYVVNAA